MWVHYKTLKALFNEPPGPLKWHKVKALLSVCSVRFIPVSGKGDSIRLAHAKYDIEIHYAPKQNVRESCLYSICNFLSEVGIDKPDAIWDFLDREGASQ